MLIGGFTDVEAKNDRHSKSGCTVCETFQAHVTLEQCTASVDVTTTPFRTPEWEPQDLMTSKDLILKLENFISRGDQFFRSRRDEPKAWESYIQQKIDFDQGHLWATTVDIDNDGTPDKVMKYADGKCPHTTAWGTALFVLDASGTRLDVAKTKPIIEEGYMGTRSEVLIHQGETYILAWDPTMFNAPRLLRFKNGRKERVQ